MIIVKNHNIFWSILHLNLASVLFKLLYERTINHSKYNAEDMVNLESAEGIEGLLESIHIRTEISINFLYLLSMLQNRQENFKCDAIKINF